MNTREKTSANTNGARPLGSTTPTLAPPRSYQAPLSAKPAGKGGEKDYESITERTARIEHKVVVAQLLLEKLSLTDGRARLLASAVLRRDEVLLDAVLGQMTDAIAALAEPQKAPLRRK